MESSARPGPESPEAIEFCLNCKSIACRSGMCPTFFEQFVAAPSEGNRVKKGKEYEWRGELHTLREWAEKLDIPLSALYARRYKGACGDKLFAPYKQRRIE